MVNTWTIQIIITNGSISDVKHRANGDRLSSSTVRTTKKNIVAMPAARFSEVATVMISLKMELKISSRRTRNIRNLSSGVSYRECVGVGGGGGGGGGGHNTIGGVEVKRVISLCLLTLCCHQR